MARAKKFYAEKLGLDMAMESDEGTLFHLKDDSVLLVYPHEGVRATNTVAGFIVEDIVAEVAELKSRGVKFENYDQPGLKTVDGIAESEGLKGAWFLDTEGNILAINQIG